MCGHGVIALTTALLETGMLPRREPRTEVVYDSPAGLIRASAMIEDGRVVSVAFRNVPAFRYAQGLELATSVGPVRATCPTAAPSTRWSTLPISGSRFFPRTRRT